MTARGILMAALFVLVQPAWGQSPPGRDIDYVYDTERAEGLMSRALSRAGFTAAGRQYAVIIGIGDYDDARFDRLPGAAKDARRLYDFLTERAGFDRVWLLTDAAATKDRLRTVMMDDLRRRVGPGDRVFFYFTGHGVSEDFGNVERGFLPLSRSRRDSVSSMISMREIGEWADALRPARQVLFVLDSCVSGLAGDVIMSELDPDLERDLGRRGHHLITAGHGDEDAYATADGSYFGQVFLDGLKGEADAAFSNRARDGAVTVSELTLYVRQRLRAELSGTGYRMTPQRSVLNNAREGEFFFLAAAPTGETAIGAGERPMGGQVSQSALPSAPPPPNPLTERMLTPGVQAPERAPDAGQVLVPDSGRIADEINAIDAQLQALTARGDQMTAADQQEMKRLIDQRSGYFDLLRNMIENYDANAKEIIQSIGR
ncbi:MAG: caspase family protein [Pseudomonadota bacterium]